MHVLLLILGALGGAAFWIYRISQAAPHVADAAQTLSNIPRRRRHARAVNRRGMDLVETPLEAATVLLLVVSRMSEDRRLSSEEHAEIEDLLVREMAMERDDADGLIRQMDIAQSELTLPESALFPMVEILQGTIERRDARRLSAMMESVAAVHGQTPEQAEFIRRYGERMNLNG